MRKGFTLLELMIVAGILAILGGIIWGVAGGGVVVVVVWWWWWWCGSSETATLAAQSWCQEMGYQADRISCAGNDSDQNGYVSCTIRTLNPSQLISVECASGYGWTEGCRLR
jgi:prepilin-type N-terminal cleavage/methylation domain-containing protein